MSRVTKLTPVVFTFYDLLLVLIETGEHIIVRQRNKRRCYMVSSERLPKKNVYGELHSVKVPCGEVIMRYTLSMSVRKTAVKLCNLGEHCRRLHDLE